MLYVQHWLLHQNCVQPGRLKRVQFCDSHVIDPWFIYIRSKKSYEEEK